MNSRAVIVRAGSKSTHNSWALGGAKTYDVLVAAYEQLPDSLIASADDYVIIPGAKVKGWFEYLSHRSDLFNKYRSIALIDDDISSSVNDINNIFELGEKNRFLIWQPSLTWGSYFSYGVSLCNPMFQVRYVNYIEMMCPFFSAERLKASVPLFTLGLETGIDRFWCRLAPERVGSYGIVDSYCVEHGRRVGLLAAQQGFSASHNAYQASLDRIAEQSGVPFHGPVAYGGISKWGYTVDKRSVMAMTALIPLLGWRQNVNKNWFYRPIFDHARHNLFRPIDNGPLDIADLIHVFNGYKPESGSGKSLTQKDG